MCCAERQVEVKPEHLEDEATFTICSGVIGVRCSVRKLLPLKLMGTRVFHTNIEAETRTRKNGFRKGIGLCGKSATQRYFLEVQS